MSILFRLLLGLLSFGGAILISSIAYDIWSDSHLKKMDDKIVFGFEVLLVMCLLSVAGAMWIGKL